MVKSLFYHLSFIFLLLVINVYGRHYVLIRRVYAGDEGRAMLEKDESSRLLGWPLGVSSEMALMDSAPIFSAVVEKNEDNEVLPAKVYRGPSLVDGRAAPRRVDVETKSDEVASSSEGDDRVFEAKANNETEKKIDIHDHEPDTAESHGSNNSTWPEPKDLTDEKADDETASSEDLDIADIEKIMSRHNIRVMGTPHPMVKKYLEERNSPADTQVQHVPPRNYQNETLDTAHTKSYHSRAIPDQVMKIAEWLLNRAP